LRLAPSKRAFLQAAFLEALAATAGAQIIAPELLFEQLVVVYDADAAFYFLFGRESFSSLAHPFEKNGWSSKSCLHMGHFL
jgi:hypothetical protein